MLYLHVYVPCGMPVICKLCRVRVHDQSEKALLGQQDYTETLLEGHR